MDIVTILFDMQHIYILGFENVAVSTRFLYRYYQKPKSSVAWVGETWLLISFQKLWNIRSQGRLIY